ncbi:WD repeat-containing protein 74 [Drosophila willistoni]|uniref:WD repeat-containing protein 74-like n=1 Tax=Drosophila willistoni TaxID=7260 RepID=UPI001F073EC4|nr:WD repeat-containing protein 74-like [Drosophila willistoni]XP_046866045.1 WD repeat-containing protein 74 [Drosophila willistoni]
MKWTTANVKHHNYTAKHEIYVGTHTGSFKHLCPADEKTPYGQSNLSDIKSLDKESRVTTLSFGNDQQTEILLGRAKNTAEICPLARAGSPGVVQVDFKAAPIVGLARYNDRLIAGIANGQIQSVLLDSEEDSEENLISAGDEMDHLRQCTQARHIVATGGKGRQNNLKIFDLAADGKQIFSSKNLPNDYLQLEVNVWDSDVGFMDSPQVVATCSRYGYVRLYDTRKQRRPVALYSSEEHGMSFATLVAHGNYIYTGTTMGALKAFDTRRMKTHVHTYKGFTGGISDLHLDSSGKYLSSASLDRYVRVHEAESTVLLYQCYVKSKATKILIRPAEETEKEETDNEDDDEEVEQQVDKRNNKQIKTTPVDDEYEDMFEQMPTVGDEEDNEDEDDNDQAETTKKQQQQKKRKASKQILQSKKKKTTK